MTGCNRRGVAALSRALLGPALLALAVAALHDPAVAAASGSAPFSSAGTTEAAAVNFLVALQDAVRAGNREAMASLIRYPARIWVGQRDVNMRTRQSFLANYATIMSSGLGQTILAATTDDLWANGQGVMFGNGRVWFRPVDGGALKIVTINAPGGATTSGQ
jgi:hypothetical protein